MQMLKNILTSLLFVALSAATAVAGPIDKSIKNERGDEIMAKVYSQFFINYEMSITHKQGFYQESMTENGAQIYVAEAIVEVFVPSNLNEKDFASVSPIRSRRKDFSTVDEEYLLLGNASDMARSSIWRPDSFLGEKLRGEYQYDYTKDSIIAETPVYVIEFSPASRAGTHKGKIYVDKERYGILRVSYEPFVENSKWWKLIVWQEDFVFRNGAYELQSVRFHGQSADTDYQYDALLLMEQLSTIGELPEGKEFLPTRTSLFEQADINPNPQFWNGYSEMQNQAKVRKLFDFENLK